MRVFLLVQYLGLADGYELTALYVAAREAPCARHIAACFSEWELTFNISSKRFEDCSERRCWAQDELTNIRQCA